MSRYLILALTLFLVAAQCEGRGLEFFVSPSGSDENPGSLDRPFATLEQARDEVRRRVADGLTVDVQVNLRGGTHCLDESNRIARTTIPATDYLCPMVQYARRGFKTNAWIENVPEGLDSPGRWMVNTRTRKIYYWPVDGCPGEDIFAPCLRELVRVEGVNDQQGGDDQPVTGICFSNLTFTQTDRGVWDTDDAGIQHDWEMVDKDNAMLRFRGAQDCRVENCRFFNAGGIAIRLDLYAQKIHH
jgi:hypothetical protein